MHFSHFCLHLILKQLTMKKLLLSLFVLIMTGAQAQNQKTASKIHPIQGGKWYATGALDGKAITLSQQKSAYDWEAEFKAGGVLNHCSTLKSAVIDATGIEVKAGTYYCDPTYSYEIRNNTIHISHLDSSYYYKISAGGKDAYTLTPAVAADFK